MKKSTREKNLKWVGLTKESITGGTTAYCPPPPFNIEDVHSWSKIICLFKGHILGRGWHLVGTNLDDPLLYRCNRCGKYKII